jgi:hypothetical protein
VIDSSAIKLSVPVLRRLNELVKAGATITGIRPIATPSLADDSNTFNQLVGEIWSSQHHLVTTGIPIKTVLEDRGVKADFTYRKSDDQSKILFVHRHMDDRDIYWVNNRTGRTEDIDAVFRMEGKVPELWFAEDGRKESLSYTIANGVTTVKLHLEPHDAVFVVFKEKAVKNNVTLAPVQPTSLVTLSGQWSVSFQKDRGAPEGIQMNDLSSWTSHTDPGVNYFSGTAKYVHTFRLEGKMLRDNPEIWLDLGSVKNIAEVNVNGRPLGILWHSPFRVNISAALKDGENQLEVEVTNLWVNRLIGDAQKEVTKKITYTTMPFYQANSPLLPSGLLGPVQLISIKR